MTPEEIEALALVTGADPDVLRSDSFAADTSRKTWTMQSILEAGRKLSGMPLSLNQFCEFTGVPRSKIYSEFGTWTICAETLEIPQRPGGREKLTPETIIEDILRVWRQIGHFPTGGDYARHGQYSRNAVFERIGRWTDLRRDLLTQYPNGP